MRAMERYPWPGNIRQLSNVIRVALALLDEHETVITENHLPKKLFELKSDSPGSAASGSKRKPEQFQPDWRRKSQS